MGLIAVAGISGYTGLRLLPHLGNDTRLLIRPSTAKRPPWRDDPRVLPIDLLDERALEPALRDIETIVCLVGTTKAQFAPARDGEHPTNYDTVDVGIPRALANAGKRAGSTRFVLLSSFGVESSPGAYPAAKRAAESAIRDSGLKFAILRPSFIVGPGRVAARALDVMWTPIRWFAREIADDMRSIDVDTLARAVAKVARSNEWDGRVLEGRDLHKIAGAT